MFAIINAEIETITKGRISKGTILVEGGKIRFVGRNVRIPKGAEVVDAGGRTVTPGLIEAHSHAGITEDGFLADGDVNESTDPVTPHLLAIDGFKPTDLAMLEAAESGVTTMYLTPGSANCFGGIGAIVKTWGESFYDQVVSTAAGMKMAMGENPKRTYGGKGQSPSTRMGIAAVIRKAFSEAQNYIAKKKAHAKKHKKDKEPFATDLKLEAIARLLAGEFPARCHAHRAIDMLTFMRIADEFKFRFTFEHATEANDILDELVKRKVAIVVGPTFLGRSKTELLHKTFATVAKAVKAGLTVAITSDHNVTPMRYLPVFAALAMREGLSAADALKTMTIHPATILGVSRRLGSIEPGKEADLVIWNGDPLDVRSKPEKVYIRGRLVDVKAARRALFERD